MNEYPYGFTFGDLPQGYVFADDGAIVEDTRDVRYIVEQLELVVAR